MCCQEQKKKDNKKVIEAVSIASNNLYHVQTTGF